MTAAKDNTATIAAIAVIAMCLTTAAHEALGHGGLCLATGGRITQLTSVYFKCAPSPWPIAIAGPAGNLLWALIATTIAGNLRGSLRFLFTLTALFSFMWEAGYMLYAALLNDGDYYFALRGMFGNATPLSRAILGAVGAALYLVSANIGRLLLGPFATEAGRIRAMLRPAWAGATVAALAAALLYLADPLSAARQALLEIGAAGAPLLLLGRASAGGDAAPIRINIVWIMAAAAIYSAFVLTLGRGVGA